MRNTKQKDAILAVINSSKDHLTAEGVYSLVKEIIPNISLGTVYRNLNVLTECGSIRRIKTDDGFDHYDNINCLHNHFICLKCNKIIDDYQKVDIKKIIDAGIVMNYDIIYKGICNDCLEEEK